ncbi:hypothetical protein PV326_006646 [Microctonus aethiopoides]|uniref:Uncharacterized protein n=1 Tax=Microctonus aethiopoides TaxID=144406 RepID=A0AA39F0N8_9HYME|nr:hypothetical protein PV326_006646 [Microctonus aethiopoides]KAK0160051.1 hypothetical protein PV328_007496 [Microctonus aethiopoides]
MLKLALLVGIFCIVVYVADAKPTKDCRGVNKYGTKCEDLLDENHQCPEGQVRISNNECRKVLSENYKCPDGYTRISTGDCHPNSSNGK